MSETHKGNNVDDRTMSSVPLTARQKQIMGMGLVLIAVSIGVFIILKLNEGNISTSDGHEFIFTVDPNVYLIMALIAFIGVLIILLTLAEFRWQKRTGTVSIGVMDLGRKNASPSKKLIPIWVQAIGRCPMCGKVILLDQKECVKCGWAVIPTNIVPFAERDQDDQFDR